jgi:hypothetical protein
VRHRLLFAPLIAFTCLGSLAIVAPATGQARPDFSGTWKLDDDLSSAAGGGGGGTGRGRGSNAQGPGLGPPPVLLVVTQTASTVRFAEQYVTGAKNTTEYGLDGTPQMNRVAAALNVSPPPVVAITSTWKGDRLVSAFSLPPARNSSTPRRFEEMHYLDRGLLVVETRMLGTERNRTLVYRRVK